MMQPVIETLKFYIHKNVYSNAHRLYASFFSDKLKAQISSNLSSSTSLCRQMPKETFLGETLVSLSLDLDAYDLIIIMKF